MLQFILNSSVSHATSVALWSVCSFLLTARMLADRHREHTSDMDVCWRVLKVVTSYKSGYVIAANSGDSMTHGNAQLSNSTLKGGSSF